MVLPEQTTLYVALAPFLVITLSAALWQIKKHEIDLEKQKKEINQKIYETLILREIGERIGYELNIGKILDTIVASLNSLLSYTAASYMLISPDGGTVEFKTHLAENVNQKFLDTVRDHLLTSVNQVTPRKFAVSDLKPTLTGAIVDEATKASVQSLWIAPLTINSRGLGAMAIASTKPSLYTGSEMEILVKLLAQANRAVNNLEKIIATEQGRLSAMVASLSDGVLMLDKNLGLIVANPAAGRLLGLPEKALPTIFDVAKSLADKVDLRAKIEESSTSGKLVTVDNLFVSDRISQLFISPVTTAGGERVGTVVLFHDVTAQKQLEQVRGDFTAMMVHELRAPLTVVRGATDMFLKNPPMRTSAQGEELLKTMEMSANSMLELVNDILDVAKIESGKFEILKTPNNLSAVVHEQAVFYEELAVPKSIKIEANVTNPDLSAEFDQERLAQVFNNLLSNAIKFTAVGGKITISASKVNSESEIKWRFQKPENLVVKTPCLLVAVADSGRGIGADKISSLFSKFKQLQPKDGEHGTGLGLVIAKGIVESHGGQIFLESRVDEGTTFYFTLPTA